MDRNDFPAGFRFGVATSAYQIEGAAFQDGRGESIWDRFALTPGNIKDGSDGSVACDHYNRWPEDLDLIRGLGADAYRFSTAWPRILPEGSGRVEPRGLDFYDRLVDGLLERGIEPHVTLYHWELPQVLEEKGGWRNRDTAHAFAEHAAAVSGRLGDRPVTYSTLNEPWCSSLLSYYLGEHAPGHRNLSWALAASHHLLLAHGLAVDVLRSQVKEGQVGIVLNFSPAVPASEAAEDEAAARIHDGFFNRWFADPVFRGSYPSDMLEVYGDKALEPEPGDLKVISQPIDFLGVNFYNRAVIAADPGSAFGYRHVRVPGEYTAMDWEVCPAALRDLLLRLQRDYSPRAMYITENGSAWDDVIVDGRIHDPARQSYLERHLQATSEAVEQGADVRGYFAWSLMDNFEWAYGYEKRFGIVHVDYGTQARTLKDSALWYQRFLGGKP